MTTWSVVFLLLLAAGAVAQRLLNRDKQKQWDDFRALWEREHRDLFRMQWRGLTGRDPTPAEEAEAEQAAREEMEQLRRRQLGA